MSSALLLYIVQVFF